MFLVVVENEQGVWESEPEIVATYSAAKDAAQRKADGTVPSLVVVTYEMKQTAVSIGRME